MTTPLAPACHSFDVSLTRPASSWFDVHPALGIAPIDHLYNRLDGAYPHKWRSNFADAQAYENWAESWVEEFEDQGITFDNVKLGINACRTRYTWPPSCAEFVLACKPFIDPVVAYHEAVAGLAARARGDMGTWSHPAVYWSAMAMRRDLTGQIYGKIKDRWANVHATQLARDTWDAIPPPHRQLAAPEDTRMSKESIEQMLRELGALGFIKSALDGGDNLLWAKRLQAQHDRDPLSMTLRQIEMYQAALGLAKGSTHGDD